MAAFVELVSVSRLVHAIGDVGDHTADDMACSGEREPAETVKAPAGPRLVLKAEDAVNWQDVSAEIATVDQAQVLARIPGILATLMVQEGDMVRAGEGVPRLGAHAVCA